MDLCSVLIPNNFGIKSLLSNSLFQFIALFSLLFYFLSTADNVPVSPTTYWVSTLQLTEGHKRQITTRKVLSNIHINAAQALLSSQFPQLSGFQLTNYSQNYDKLQVASNNSIQIHHTDTFHWAVSTSIGRPRNCRARILDSMSGDLSSSMQCQLLGQWWSCAYLLYVQTPRNELAALSETLAPI